MVVQAVSSAVGINQPSPTPLPTPTVIESPTPSATSVSITTNNQIQQKSQPKVTGDGSRTGRIVPYKEYCTGNQISVYENEIINKVSSFDGKTYGMTQGDWNCYDRNNITAKQPAITTANKQTQQPSNAGSGDTKPKVNCSVTYCSGETKTYQVDQATCDMILSWNTGCTPKATPAPTLDPATQQYLDQDYQRFLEQERQKKFDDNQFNHGQCVKWANDWYTNQGTQCGGSCAQAIKQLAYPEYQQKLAGCDSQYPVK